MSKLPEAIRDRVYYIASLRSVAIGMHLIDAEIAVLSFSNNWWETKAISKRMVRHKSY